MESLRDDIIAGRESGEFRARLRRYCWDWKRHPTAYALANAVRYAADNDQAEKLYDILLDEDFRELRGSGSGANDLRDDLETGRDFFSGRRPDLLRYLRIVSLEQETASEDEDLALQRLHCRSFADFLQLDRLPAERKNIGLHRALNRFFPIGPEETRGNEPARPRNIATLRLAGYELGQWNCSCGKLTGHSRRYDHRCPCGALSGNGRLPAEPESCAACDTPASYVTCGDCGTRVTLELLWTVRRGNAHPSVYRIPLTLDIVIEQPGGADEHIQFTLMHLPVMPGLQERRDSISFQLPAMFWFHADGPQSTTGRFAPLPDEPRYDRQTDLCKIFEAAFRRTLWRLKGGHLTQHGGYHEFSRRLRDALWNDRETELKAWERTNTWELEKRLAVSIGVPDSKTEDLLRFIDASRECVVAASPLLRGTMVLANRRLARPGALSPPQLISLTAVVNAQDTLTPNPPSVPKALTRALGEDGIARPGAMVPPGGVLVGLATPVTRGKMTAEERLLREIFGETNRRNISLTLPGKQPARVLAQYISRDPDGPASEIRSIPGRFVACASLLEQPQTRASPPEQPRASLLEHMRVMIVLAVDQPLETGDVLLTDSASSGVVCGIVGGAALRRVTGDQAEPDLVVAPTHPWTAEPNGPAGRSVRVRLRKAALAGQEASSRAYGLYSLTSQQPLSGEREDGPGQVLNASDFRWLVDHGARSLAFELYGPRSDCVEWRVQMYGNLIRGNRRLADLRGNPVAEWRSLQDSPTEAVRNWDRHLRGGGIRTVLERGRLRFEPMTDQDVLTLSCGRVNDREMRNLLTGIANRSGLVSEQIFGPENSWECACGELRGRHCEGLTCEDCGVEVADSRVRRDRMGHIELPVPVVNCWYVHGTAGERLASVLNLSGEGLREIVRCERSVVVNGGALTGGEAMEALLRRAVPPFPSPGVVIRRIPVLPADLRPFVLFRGGGYANSDLNDLYRSVLFTGDQLRRSIELNAPETVLAEAKALLQKKVDNVLDNQRSHEPALANEKRPRASISDGVRRGTGKTLRDGFLRRPVDYSARTRLVTGDTPDPRTALVPVRLAWNLFMPLLVNELIEMGVSTNVKAAKQQLGARSADAYAALEKVCASSLLLLAPHSGPWPLLALHTRPTADLALCVHPDLLTGIGWGNLGEPVRIFAVLTAEAQRDAVGLLTPDRLREEKRSRPGSEQGSVFDIDQNNVPDRLVEAALDGSTFPLCEADKLILCDTDWLGVPSARSPSPDHRLHE
jgi:hypothetical protein